MKYLGIQHGMDAHQAKLLWQVICRIVFHPRTLGRMSEGHHISLLCICIISSIMYYYSYDSVFLSGVHTSCCATS